MSKFLILLLAAILVPSMLGYVKASREVQAKYEDYSTSAYDDYYSHSFEE